MSTLPLTINNFKNDIIIGFFDVLHKGHAKLFKQHPHATILTFDSIPRKTNSINDLQTRLANLQAVGFEKIMVMDATSMQLTAQTFVDQYLKYARCVIVGDDFIFGSDQQPIQLFENQLHLELINYDINYSTTIIKQHLCNGEIEKVNKLLMNPFAITKIVEHGNHFGRILGFPTINFYFPNGVFLQSGVYITKTYVANQTYQSLSVVIKQKNVAHQTIDTIETHLLDCNQDLYHQRIQVEFKTKIGDLKHTKNIDELKQLIQGYVDIAKHLI